MRRILLILPILLALLSACGPGHDKAQLMAAARQARAQGELKAAVIQLKNVLQQDPSDGPARLLLGAVYQDMSDMPAAEKELRRALDLGQAPRQVWPALGQVLLAQGQYEQLLSELKLDAQSPDMEALRAQAMIGLGRSSEARSVLDGILASFPSHPAALQAVARLELSAGQPDNALMLVQRSLAAHPEDIDGLRLRGDLLRLKGMRAEALRDYQRVLQLRPRHVPTLLDIANLQIQAGNYREAKEALAAVRKVMPESLPLIYTQSLLDFREGHLQAARDQLQLILRAAPEHMPSNLLMGAVLSGLGSGPQAQTYLRHFLEAYPRHVYASKLLAMILLRSGNAEQARQLLAPLLEMRDGQQDADLLGLAGDTYMALGDAARAAHWLELASKLAPKAPLLHAALGMSRLSQGDNDRAIAELEQATRLDSSSARSGILLVLAQLRNKAFPQALETVRQLQAQHGRSALLLNLEGGIRLFSKDLPSARACFEQALALDPKFFPALDNLTQLDLRTGKAEDARKRLEAALSRDPKELELTSALAKLALAQGQPAVAANWLQRATADHPNALAPAINLLRFYLGNRDSGKALLLARKLEASHPDHADVLSLLAEAQSQSGSPDDALESLGKLALLRPDSAEVQYRIAQAHIQLHQPDKVMQALRKALSLRPDYPQAQVLLIQALFKADDTTQALQLARQVQWQHPTSPLGFKLEGDISMARQQPAAAVGSYQKAFDLQANGSQLIPLYHALSQAGRRKEAEQRIAQWLAAHTDDLPVRQYFATSLLDTQNYPAAIAQFETVLKREPDNIMALNNLAWSCLQIHDPRALDFAEHAYRLAPRNPAVADTLGWILAQQGNLARALPLLKAASEQAGQAEEIRYHYGAALARAGDLDAARRQLQPLLDSKDFARRSEIRALLAHR